MLNNHFKSVAKKLFTLAWPMASIQFITIAGMFLTMMMLSKLGHQVLAASALIFSTQVTLIIVGSSLLFSLSILVSHAFGAKDYLGIGNFVQQGWTLGTIIAVPMVVCALSIKKILIIMGQKPEIAELVQQYFHVYVFAIPAIMLVMTNQQFCYGIRQQSLVTLNNRISTGLLLLCAYAFIFGKFGLPTLGIQGAALAMVVASWFTVFFMMVNFIIKPQYQVFELFRYRVHQNWHYLYKMFQIGWPISLQISAELICFSALAVMVGWLGTSALAAYQIVTQYNSLIVVPLFALAQASGVIIGQACGAEEYADIKKLGHASLLMASVVTLVTAIIFLTMPKLLSSFYLEPNDIHYKETLHLVVILFAIMAVIQIFDGLRNVMTGALRGLFDTRFPMWIGVFALWSISIPCAYLLAFKLHWGIAGISVGMGIGMLAGLIAILWRWQKLALDFDKRGTAA
jgi:MATE family multidrug resistance protein